MISYYDSAMQSSDISEVIEINGTAVGIYSKISDPDQIILYIPGGVKSLGLLSGSTFQPNGFTWRWLPLWLQRGAALAVVDMPKEFYEIDMSPEHRRTDSRMFTIRRIIDYLRERFPNSSINGYGHSYGSLEMSILCTSDLLDKIVIGSGNWNSDPNKDDPHADIFVDNLDVNQVKVPLLLVHHLEDATPKCQYNAVKTFMKKFDSITVNGGLPHLGNPGLDPGPHFFHLQENDVVKNIVLWLRNKKYNQFIL